MNKSLQLSKKKVRSSKCMAKNKRPVTVPPLIFNVYKPVGPTSADLVQHFKKHLPQGFGKIGHLGTLDPFAEGVLLIAVAGAARANEYFHEASPKHYRAVGRLGPRTNTGDREGDIIAQKEIPPHWNAEELQLINSSLQKKFCGSYWQEVPQFSAVKHQGRPLYEYARRGEVIEKPKVLRRVYSLNIVRRDADNLEIEAVVGTGTYIRSLFEDICEFVGTYGHLTQLVRTQVGAHKCQESLGENQWPKNRENFDMSTMGLTLDQALPLPFIVLDAKESSRYRHGQTLTIVRSAARFQAPLGFEQNLDMSSCREICWVFDDQSVLCGLGRQKGAELKVVFNLPKFLA